MVHWVASRYLPGEGFRTSCQNLGNFSRPHLVLVPEGNLRTSCVSRCIPDSFRGKERRVLRHGPGGLHQREPERANTGRTGSQIEGGAT